jgi:hypothetical protein
MAVVDGDCRPMSVTLIGQPKKILLQYPLWGRAFSASRFGWWVQRRCIGVIDFSRRYSLAVPMVARAQAVLGRKIAE